MKKWKTFILFLVLFFIFIILLYVYRKNIVFDDNLTNKTHKTIFSIDKITFFSSASADIEISHATTFNNLLQYTDMALFINNKNSSELISEENTLKELYISNLKFNVLPSLGSPNLYYKNINDFATNKYNTQNKIQDDFYFDISSENEIDYELPTLYNNCANPITFSYINSNILNTPYSIANSANSFYYDGTLLKNCNILLSSLNCTFSFDIFLKNNLDQKFKCPVEITIPLQNESSSIYQGTILIEDNVNFVFENID